MATHARTADRAGLPRAVWRSRDFLVMIYDDRGYERLSVIRTALDPTHRFTGQITWDDLQRLKRECGRGALWAVECYPPDDDVVNIQNMRHLFLLKEPPPYGWHGRANGGDTADTDDDVSLRHAPMAGAG